MKKNKYILMVLTLMTVLIPMTLLIAQAADPSFDSLQFRNKWLTQDHLVGVPGISRPYTWGPSIPAAPNGLSEAYADAPGGTRRVQYFDKGRMELNNPATGFVTAGLIVRELVTGQRQDGDNTFTTLSPSQTQVAGDPVAGGGNPNVPTYASFQNLVTLGNADDKSKPSAIGATISTSLDRAGNVGTITPPDAVTIGAYEGVTGHNIAKPFQDFKSLTGPTTDPVTLGQLDNQPVYTNDPTSNVFGFAISEPYWVNARVAGVDHMILVQLFQRRVLTYNPSLSGSTQVQKVEMGNVGQHYYQWRYVENSSTTTPTPTTGTTTPTPTPTPTATPTPTPSVPMDYSQARANYNKAGGGIPAGGTSNTYTAGFAINSSAAVDLSKNLAVVGTSVNLQGINLNSLSNIFTFKPSGGAVFFNDPAIFNGTIYDGGSDGRVYAVDENASGPNVVEKAKTNPASAAVTGGVAFSPDATQLYFSAGTSLYAVDLGTLTNQKWVQTPGGTLTAPVVDANGIIYVGSSTSKLYAFHADGTPVTNYPVTVNGALSRIVPALANGNIYVGTDAGTVYKINSSNGTVVWNSSLAAVDINTTAAVSGGAVYVGADDNKVYKLDDSNGAILSTFSGAANKIQSSPAVVDGFYYFGDLDGKLWKVDANNSANQTLLLTGIASFGSNSPVVAGGKVYIAATDGAGTFYVVR